MLGISIKIENKLKEQLSQLAQKEKISISQILRRLIEDGLAVANYKEQNPEAVDHNSASNKQKLEAEYKRNFEYMMLEVASLLYLIVKDSGKFTPEEAKRLLSMAHIQVETYMKYYENGGRAKKISI